jgi:hypothetical protein
MKRRRVAISQAVVGHLRELGKEAVKTGRGKQFLNAVRLIHDALQEKPLPLVHPAFGCPQYHLPNMQLLVCAAVISPVVVRFAIPDVVVEGNGVDTPVVYVLRFDLLSGAS